MFRSPRATLAALALPLALMAAPTPASANGWDESAEARQTAATAAWQSLETLEEAFGVSSISNGKYRWKDGRDRATRVVVNLNTQMLFVYDGSEMIAASTISSGRESNPTPTGIFPIMEKNRHHRSNKYNDAPMPYMQRLDTYGIALHAGDLPGYPASHGCIRLPKEFAARLFKATEVGTEVLVGGYQETGRYAQADKDDQDGVS